MRKKSIYIVILLIFCSFLTGCWSRRELNEIAIVIGLGIDKVGDEYLVTTQVVDPTEIASTKGGSGRAPAITYRAKGHTIFSAIRSLTASTPRRLYLAHLRIFAIGESLAKEGIAPFLDVITRSQELRSDFHMIITKGVMAKDLLDILTPLDKVPSTYMFTMLRQSERFWAPLTTVNIDQLNAAIESEGKEPILPAIEVRGALAEGKTKDNIENILLKTYLNYSGLGVFKKDKLLGWLDEDESSGYNYLIDNVKRSVVEIPCGRKKNVIEIMDSKTKLKSTVIANRPKISGTINMEANVGELQCKSDLLDLEAIRKLEVETDKVVKRQIQASLMAAQKKYQSDIFGFGDMIHRSNPKDWNKLKQNWGQTFSNLPVNVDVQVKIINFGKVNRTTPEPK